MNPLVSILVPTYNAAAYLPDLCRSILAQTYQDFEVLILDDGSTDCTREALQPFAKDSRFQVCGWTSNRGVNAATLALLAKVKGEFWCNPGADDLLAPDFLRQRLDRLQAHPEAVIVHGPPNLIDSAGRPMPDPSPTLKLPARTEGQRALKMLLQHNVINTSSVLIRSEFTRLVLPLFLSDWRYAQDWFCWLLHLATGFDLLWDEQPLHQYRVHDKSLSLAPAYQAVRRAEIRLVPLCALSASAQISRLAAELWARWRKTLYCAWLNRAANLWRAGLLRQDWLDLAARAYYGKNAGHAFLVWELARHGLGSTLTWATERRFMQTQSLRVCGVAQLDDPVFHRRA
jgi:glycosyltransferase involved in cell wall biosynthesis